MKYREIFILNAIGIIPVSLLFICQFSATRGVSSYLNEISTNTATAPRMILYIFLLIIYSIAVEFVLKRLVLETAIQKYDKKGAILGTILVTLLYLLVHSRYGTIGSLLYSGTLVIGTSIRYIKNRCWKTNAIWHVQWNIASFVVGLLLLNYTNPSEM